MICLGLSGGVATDSKTTGTQLQISPEVKAEIDDEVGTEELREPNEGSPAGRGKKAGG